MATNCCTVLSHSVDSKQLQPGSQTLNFHHEYLKSQAIEGNFADVLSLDITTKLHLLKEVSLSLGNYQ